jgi:hypothetical protein
VEPPLSALRHARRLALVLAVACFAVSTYAVEAPHTDLQGDPIHCFACHWAVGATAVAVPLVEFVPSLTLAGQVARKPAPPTNVFSAPILPSRGPPAR